MAEPDKLNLKRMLINSRLQAKRAGLKKSDVKKTIIRVRGRAR